MKLSEHFSREEFACKCGCGFSVVDVELLEILEVVRNHFKTPVVITSACRCEAHNEAEGGSKNSKHKLGIAVDVVVKDIPAYMVYNFVDNFMPHKGGLGKYETFTHIDVRDNKARW